MLARLLDGFSFTKVFALRFGQRTDGLPVVRFCELLLMDGDICCPIAMR